MLALAGCAERGNRQDAANAANAAKSDAAAPLAYPAAAARPVSEMFHGVTVSDDYRWLEDTKAPEVAAFIAAENALTRSTIDAIPQRADITRRVGELLSAQVTRWMDVRVVGGVIFAVKMQPPAQQPVLVVLKSLEDPAGARVLLDPNTMNAGKTTMDWFVPSPDGKMIAASLSTGGNESGDVHVYDVASGREVGEMVPRVNGGTAGGGLAWQADSKGFCYTRYPRAGERGAEDMDFYLQVYSHKLGTPTASDMYEMGRDLPRIAEITLEACDFPALNGALLASVQKGDGGEFIFFLRSAVGKWTQICGYEDRVVQAAFGPDSALWLISRKDAPRGKILRLALNGSGAGAANVVNIANAREIIPQSENSIVSAFGEETGNFVITKSHLYVTYQLGGPSEVRVFDLQGRATAKPKLLPISAVGGVHPLGEEGVLFTQTSYVDAPAWFTFDPATGGTRRTGLATTAPVDFSPYEVVREMATSKDGTQVPVNIVRKKGMKQDGNAPALLTAYGGYGVNREPAFRAGIAALLERGFVWAEANVRGGGEFGDEWHRNGALTKKQNVFDDFQACAQHLITRGYTSSNRLAIEGGSNGGLLMGATLVQRPDLVKAVVSHVGIYDMLRVELSSNGAFNVPEFGTVKDPAQFKALYAYSPLHNVKDGTKYPATLLLTGLNDPRVESMQSRKMAARLQRAVSGSGGGGGPVLLRTSMDSGHGMGTPLSERVAQTADAYAFVCWQLGVK